MVSQTLSVNPTPVEGLLVVELPLLGDNRGWFKEHWQREKMVKLGLPDFGPVQQNISFNAAAGTTRGIHAEPWDKYVSVANGRAFGAWVDLREGPGFGSKFSIELTPGRAVFVPRGVANAFQTLEPDTSYMYLVNDHWSANAEYTFVNLGDPTLAIEWPIPLDRAIVSEKDLAHPFLEGVSPMSTKDTVVLGANGQLGLALREVLPGHTTRFLTREDLDLSSHDSIINYDWNNVGTIINAAAYTAVDVAELPDGCGTSWQINAVAVGTVAKVAREIGAIFVNVSSDYVFDGETEVHLETESYSPRGVYGQTKAAGEIAALTTPKSYVIRTSWVVGDGNNFVRTMKRLAENGVNPSVINDQYGRLTFASELARGIKHLIDVAAPFGIYNLSGTGPVLSWFDVASEVFDFLGFDRSRVAAVSSESYAKQQRESGKVIAPRPKYSAFSLEKIEGTGFFAKDQLASLKEYLSPQKV